MKGNYAFNTLKDATDAVFLEYAILSCSIKYDMQHLFAQCKQMMGVTDKELDAYRQERAKIDKESAKKDEYVDSLTNEYVEQQKRIFDAREKWNKKE